MDPSLIAVAFVLGFAARQVGLPPLVGFLVAGFALSGAGLEGGPMLSQIADLGVILLLFSIGLKLKVETLLKPEVWAGATLHMLATVVVLGLASSRSPQPGFTCLPGSTWRPLPWSPSP